jgi:DNA gyrase subunit B
VRAIESGASDVSSDAPEPEEASAPLDGDVPAKAAAPGGRPPKKEPDATLADLDQFVEFFIAAGKKGVAVNRYKGLGEMNPDTLWNTTMDPEHRTLLEVRAEDHAEADQMFTTLMGDQVEPRRKFIEDNALDVRNLDV